MTTSNLIPGKWTAERLADRAFLVLFLIQGVVFFDFLISIPLHYDEWMSYYSYTSNDLKTILTSYSSTNNHIFYNLVAHLFVLLPFSDEVGMRLPAYLASLLCLVVFYRTCKTQFSPALSFLLSALLSGSYLFNMYSFEARGYCFVMVFVIMTIYGLTKLSADYKQTRYRVLYVVALLFGFWSLPTFLYAFIPVWLCCIPFVVKQGKNNLVRFLADTSVCTALVALVYTPIFLLNNVTDVLSGQGEAKLTWSSPDYWAGFLGQCKGILLYLFRFDCFYYWLALVLLTPLISFLTGKRNISFLAAVSHLVFISPFLYVLMFGLVPYARVWVYILLAAFICLGFFIRSVSGWWRINQGAFKPVTTVLCFLVVIIIYTWKLMDFKPVHRENSAWDYQLADVRESSLGPLLATVNEISHTTKGFEFYPAGILLYYTKAADRDRVVRLTAFDKVRGQDLLVLDSLESLNWQNELGAYEQFYKKEGILFYKIKTPSEPRH